MKSLGAKAYRFSISWSRVIPLGGRDDPVNEAGLQYYVNLVDELLANGLEPMVTLFHWDLPQALDERYGGFLNGEEYTKDYVRYARVVFKALGSKVKKWITCEWRIVDLLRNVCEDLIDTCRQRALVQQHFGILDRPVCTRAYKRP